MTAIKNIKKKKSRWKSSIRKNKIWKTNRTLKKLKDDEKNDYEEQIKKLKKELNQLKLLKMEQQNKNDSLLNNYKNNIKLVNNQYIKHYYMYIIGAIILIIAIIKFL